MILVLSNAEDATSDFFVDRLIESRVPYLRINTEKLAQYELTFTLVSGAASVVMEYGNECLSVASIRSIYYRRPRPVDLSLVEDPYTRIWMQNEFRQAWGGVLMSLSDVRWVNHPIQISSASYKPEQLARATHYDLQVPATLLTTEPEAALGFCEKCEWKVIAKPVGHGEIRRGSAQEDELVYTNIVDRQHLESLSDVANCPTLFQRMVPKRYDVRVTIAGDTCLAVALHSQENPISAIDCRRDNMVGMQYSLISLPQEISDRLVRLTHSYGLYFAAIDLVLDPSGTFWFLELNAAGQWAWLEQHAGASISQALIRTLTDP